MEFGEYTVRIQEENKGKMFLCATLASLEQERRGSGEIDKRYFAKFNVCLGLESNLTSNTSLWQEVKIPLTQEQYLRYGNALSNGVVEFYDWVNQGRGIKTVQEMAASN